MCNECVQRRQRLYLLYRFVTATAAPRRIKMCGKPALEGGGARYGDDYVCVRSRARACESDRVDHTRRSPGTHNRPPYMIHYVPRACPRARERESFSHSVAATAASSVSVTVHWTLHTVTPAFMFKITKNYDFALNFWKKYTFVKKKKPHLKC